MERKETLLNPINISDFKNHVVRCFDEVNYPQIEHLLHYYLLLFINEENEFKLLKKTNKAIKEKYTDSFIDSIENVIDSFADTENYDKDFIHKIENIPVAKLYYKIFVKSARLYKVINMSIDYDRAKNKKPSPGTLFNNTNQYVNALEINKDDLEELSVNSEIGDLIITEGDIIKLSDEDKEKIYDNQDFINKICLELVINNGTYENRIINIYGEEVSGKTYSLKMLQKAIDNGKVPNQLKNKKIIVFDYYSHSSEARALQALSSLIEKIKDSDRFILAIDYFTFSSPDKTNNVLFASADMNEIKTLKELSTNRKIRNNIIIISEENAEEVTKNKVYGLISIKVPEYSEKEVSEILNLTKGKNPNHKYIASIAKKYLTKKNTLYSSLELYDYSKKLSKIKKKALSEKIVDEAMKIKYDITITDDNYQSVMAMKNNIVGQEDAIKKISNILRSVKINKALEPNRPLATFLFVGSPGVGKTETAKLMAKYYFGNEKAYIQLNGGEYQDKTAIHKIIGSSAGFVGYGDKGFLPTQLEKNPSSVIVFDELEKFDENIIMFLYSLLDEGEFTTGSNITYSIRNCVVVFTSNLGTDLRDGYTMFRSNNLDQDKVTETVKKALPAPIVSRINSNHIIFYRQLNEEDAAEIARNFVSKYNSSVDNDNDILEVSNEEIKEIISSSEIKKYGAREIRGKVIQKLSSKLISKNK